MDKIAIHDTAENLNFLGFDLRDVLEAIGEPALDALWTAGSGEEELWVTGDGAQAVENLVQTGERISGRRLLEIAATIHQTIWGEFKGYETATSPEPWIIVIAFDSNWFEVHSTEMATLDRVRVAFKDVRAIED
jgi:hypothetical protein